MESTTPFKESYELGYAQIQLRNLTFPFARDKELAAVDCLAAIFKERCDPDAMENQIPVFVSPSELVHILTQTPGIELETLAHGQPPFPRLKPTGDVRCLHGRQRYEAAMRNFGPEKWWSVRIFRIPEGSDPEILLLRHIDQSSHQMKLSDGDVFRHVFACRRMRQRENENYWHLHLSKDKKGALKRILEDEVMSELLYELTDYPGLRNGWQLGNIDKHFADRCPEEIYNYLRHIKETWRKITLNNSDVRLATDNETVKELTLLCPSASYADNDKVRLLMRSGKLFGSISDSHLRGQIEQQLLGIGVVIPSIETFHGNMKYLRVGMRILRDHLLDGRPLGKHETVAQAMQEIWQPRETLIEHAEHQFYPITCSPSFSLAFQALFISALRNFPHLSAERPIVQHGIQPIHAGTDESTLKRFLLHAQAQGFNSSTIESKLRSISTTTLLPVPSQSFPCKSQESVVKRRCGRPLTCSYRYIANNLFLPRMLRENEICLYPSTMFVQCDFMRSFFAGFPKENSVIDQDTILRAHDLHLSSTSTPAASVEIQQQSATTDLEGLDTSYRRLGSDSAVISAAQSALNRRRMRQPQSESPRSILVPDVQQASSPNNCWSLGLTDCPLNEDGSTPSFGTPPRRTATTSIGSQLTQDSATTGRTMISPGDIMEYMRIDKVGDM